MDKVQKTLRVEPVRNDDIAYANRAIFQEYLLGRVGPPVEVRQVVWWSLVEFARRYAAKRMRIDKVIRNDNKNKFLYVVQFTDCRVKYTIDALRTLHDVYAREELGMKFICHQSSDGTGRMKWVFFVSSSRCKMQEVMQELHDAASSWLVFGDPSKQTRESVKESFDYFMESFHLPTIEET